MIARYQLPVYSPVRIGALPAAALSALRRGRASHDAVGAAIAGRWGGAADRTLATALTDSGTSALVMALRLAAGDGGTVLFPGYACVDLAAAAQLARVRVRLYDVDPSTLSPDLDSLERALARGADAVLVAHLYGFPTNVPAVAALARSRGATLIEDAAQAAGGSLGGTRLGGFGPLTVLSFGRGKGTTGGSGGALLGFDEWAERVRDADLALADGGAGWRDLAGVAAQWGLGRPALYGVPASIPSLRLGEMVYHPAHEPARMSVAAAALLRGAIAGIDADTARRRRIAAALMEAIPPNGTLAPARPVAGGEPGYLRLPLRAAGRAPAPRLGVLRAYPVTMAEMEELRPCLHDGEQGTALPGATELARTLLTLPTHRLVTRGDVGRLQRWLREVG